MADPFEEYFEAYASAFDEFDADRVASFLHCPCLMVDREVAATLSTERAIADNVHGLLEYHRAQGYGRASVHDLRVTIHEENLAIVTLRWRVADRKGSPLWSWLNTYNLVDHGAGWKILVSTTHSESSTDSA